MRNRCLRYVSWMTTGFREYAAVELTRTRGTESEHQETSVDDVWKNLDLGQGYSDHKR